MAAVAIPLYPTRPAEQPVPQVTSPQAFDLEGLVESVMCSCSAGDDNPN